MNKIFSHLLKEIAIIASYPCNRPWRTLWLETSRLPHFLDNRITDVVVSLTRRPAALYPQEDLWYSFLLEAESTPGP
jgi:hypothetical protein